MCIYADTPSLCDQKCGHMDYPLDLPDIFQLFHELPPLPVENGLSPIQLMFSLEEQNANFNRILEQSTAVYELVARLEQNVSQIEGFIQQKHEESTTDSTE